MSEQPSKTLSSDVGIQIFFFYFSYLFWGFHYMYQRRTEQYQFLSDCVCFCRDIVDNHEKENALNIVTDERTYHIYAESPEDARYAISIDSIDIMYLLCLFCMWCFSLS